MNTPTPNSVASLFTVLLWFFGCHATPAIAGPDQQVNPFVSGSLQQIEGARQGRPFLLVMWSLECASCRKELDMLAETRLKNPAIDIVMVAIDEGPDGDALGRFLDEHRLEDIEAWYFAEPDSSKLRYEVDSAWYGEIPRTYFYGPDHQRVAVSGMVKPEQLNAWLSLAAMP